MTNTKIHVVHRSIQLVFLNYTQTVTVCNVVLFSMHPTLQAFIKSSAIQPAIQAEIQRLVGHRARVHRAQPLTARKVKENTAPRGIQMQQQTAAAAAAELSKVAEIYKTTADPLSFSIFGDLSWSESIVFFIFNNSCFFRSNQKYGDNKPGRRVSS